MSPSEMTEVHDIEESGGTCVKNNDNKITMGIGETRVPYLRVDRVDTV